MPWRSSLAVQNVTIKLNVIIECRYAENLYAECRYAECSCTDCHGVRIFDAKNEGEIFKKFTRGRVDDHSRGALKLTGHNLKVVLK